MEPLTKKEAIEVEDLLERMQMMQGEGLGGGAGREETTTLMSMLVLPVLLHCHHPV
jgi:hypothetical protein